MLRTDNLLKNLVLGIAASVTISAVLTDLSALSMNPQIETQRMIASLADGNHQFCSKPKTSSLNGSGVCFNFAKTGDRVDGYYAYPHTDELICLRGKVSGTKVTGEALAISWAGREWINIPKAEFKWDEEGLLTLNNHKIIRSSNVGGDRTDWILFRQAELDTKGFYQYPKPFMTPPSQLCQWE